MSGQPKVSIVILNWNGLDDTLECLEALRSCTYPNCETIVVDNGSAGDQVRRLRQKVASGVHIIENPENYGFAGGCNVGIRFALSRGADYVLLLNNDTIVDPAFLGSLVAAAEELPDAAALCPKVCYYDSPRVI